MQRRKLILTTAAASFMALPLRAQSGMNSIDDGGVRFDWTHRDGRLYGVLRAPTQGWIAVGFNPVAAFEGTRFVIATVARAPIVVEEHIALVPDHRRVEVLGGSPAIADLDGRFDGGISRLAFSLPVVTPAPFVLDLAPGRRTHLMLAWSLAPEFDHHSAWRNHYDVTL